jgi:uncharacterized membrane protein
MWGSWGMPMCGFGWLFPLIGFALCLAFVVVMMRIMSGGRFTWMGGHERGGADVADLRRQVLELREEVNRLKVAQ